MKPFYIFCIAFIGIPYSIYAQTAQIKEKRRSYTVNKIIESKVRLVQANDTILSFKASSIQIIDQRKSDFNFLGAYDDWNTEGYIVWLFLHETVESEFQDYLDKVLIEDVAGSSLVLKIVEFTFRQTMFSNGKRVRYKYEYQLESTIDGKKSVSSLKGNVKIENIKGPEDLLEPIKQSLWQLILNSKLD